MTPAARVQTSIELLDAVINAAKSKAAPADRVLAEWFRSNRFAGSKDRRAIRELVYAAIRACGPIPKTGRAAMLRLAEVDPCHCIRCSTGRTTAAPAIGKREIAAEGGIAPAWLVERLANSDITGKEADALLERAPLDLRVNSLKRERAALELPVDATPTAAPNGLRIASGTVIEQWSEFREGLVEVQDSGSQIACLAVGAQPGETVIDLCAGAGGKTLALAASMENLGRLIACDTDRGRLSRLAPRAQRAGATNIESRLLNPGQELEALDDLIGKADAVLIDAPCSGTGTWRRNPEARWRLDPKSLGRRDRRAGAYPCLRTQAVASRRAHHIRDMLAAGRGRRRTVRRIPRR